MLHSFTLLLPALIPSWRFFDTIAPSPRIEFAVLASAEDMPACWQEFCLRPAQLGFAAMLARMVWNPQWNESLYLVACAERVMATPTEHSVREITTRIAATLPATTLFLQFRLVFISRNGAELQRHITYISAVQRAVS